MEMLNCAAGCRLLGLTITNGRFTKSIRRMSENLVLVLACFQLYFLFSLRGILANGSHYIDC